MSKAVIIVLSSLLLVAAIGAVSYGYASNWGIATQEEEDGKRIEATNKAVQGMCNTADYKDACFKSLSGVETDNPKELIKTAVESAKDQLSNVTQNSTVLKELENDPKTANAVKNCKELFNDAGNDLQRSFDEIDRMEWNAAEDMVGNLKSWLSASITYQETCLNGFDNTTGDAPQKVRKLIETSMQISSNGLAIIDDMSNLLGSLEPNSMTRRRLLEARSRRLLSHDGMLARRRHLGKKLNLGDNELKAKANVVVDKNGSGKYKTIGDALKNVPKNGVDWFVVYIKNGTYNEYLVVETWMTHVVFVGDGPKETRISHNKNFVDGTLTFKTATLSVLGDFFMAKDIGIENTSGAEKRLAVALRVQSDESIFYNVHVDGHQDTLYVHTYRQFYHNCRISGTIDFVFGDAAAFFQNCTFVVRKPMKDDNCTVTAQSRSERHQSTGIIIHRSRVEAESDFDRTKNNAYLGRPMNEYSRTIIMETYIGDLIQPKGWMPWMGNFSLETCYYSEFLNEGPGSSLDNRVKWGGIKSITYRLAEMFLPRRFFETDSWIHATGVFYEPDLHSPRPSPNSARGPTSSTSESTSKSPKSSPSESSSTPKADKRETSEIATVHDLERRLETNEEYEIDNEKN